MSAENLLFILATIAIGAVLALESYLRGHKRRREGGR